jgi:excisionase family DNA binding protein
VLRKDWYTTAEVGELLGFTDRWVRRQIELGRLKAYAFDAGNRRTLRIRRQDLDEFRRKFIHDARGFPPLSER